jgi:hypothetical protein
MGWESSVPKERSLPAPTGALPSIEIATKREYKAETSAAAVVGLKCLARRRLVTKKEYSRHEIEVSKPHDCGAQSRTCDEVGGMGVSTPGPVPCDHFQRLEMPYKPKIICC